MTEVKGASNSCPVEMWGSRRWNLYHLEAEDNSAYRYVSTIDMRLGPGGTLIGAGIDKDDDYKVIDIFGTWNDQTIDFTCQSRNDRYDSTTVYKGFWFEDFQTIKGTFDGAEELKFEMKLESQENIANPRKPSENFFKNLTKYYINSPDKMSYDFHIFSRDGEKIPAHKFILGSQSEYFAALFRKEGADDVKLDYPGNAIKNSIDFLYSQKVNFTVDNVQDILAFSNYTNLDNLEELANAFIIRNMDISNVIDVLLLSDFLANGILRNASINFIAKNFQELFQSNDNANFLPIPKHLFKEIIGSKSLILSTNRGITITGDEREYGILSFIKTYVGVHNIKDEIVTFLPYLRLDLTDEIRAKIFSSLSKEITPFEVLSSEPREYSFEWSTKSDRYHPLPLGTAPRSTFREMKTFEALGNKNKFIDSIVITEKEWDNTIIVSGLKINWSDGTSDIVGTQEGNQVKLEVPEGEHVVSVVGKAGWFVDSLALVTSSGKVVGPAGGDGGGRKNVLACLESHCEMTRTFVDGISGCVVRTNSNPDTWTVARLRLKFVSATNKKVPVLK